MHAEFGVDYQRISEVLQDVVTESAKKLGVDVAMLGNWAVVIETLSTDEGDAPDQPPRPTYSVVSPQLHSRVGVVDTAALLWGGVNMLRSAFDRHCDDSDDLGDTEPAS